MTRTFIACLVVMAAVMLGGASAASSAVCGATSLDPPDRFQVPLTDGSFALGDLIARLVESVGIEPPPSLAGDDWTIDVVSAPGRAQMEIIERFSGGILTVEVAPDHLMMTLDRAALQAADRNADDAGARWIERLVRVMQQERRGDFGLTFVSDHHDRPAFKQGADEHVVLLVHGIDDPGWMWRDVIPALVDQGFVVARFDYPNDGSIAESADLLALCLAELRTAKVEHVDVVAHSMGGLVTREVLTRRSYYARNGAGSERFPAIDTLTMCGTPNHGSHLARLQAFTEFEEQITRAFAGEGEWLGAMNDGRGEAAIDLLPDSEFLVELNSRGRVDHTRMTIIAGRMSPVTETHLRRLSEEAERILASERTPAWLRDLVGDNGSQIPALLEGVVRGVGDGCVTIDSARLDGVDDFVIVDANHASMIVNVFPSADNVPPAIPIILDRLAQSATGPTGE